MAILITGGAGYIGSHTCVELLNKKEELVIVDNFVNSNKTALENIKKITGKEFTFYELDILDKEKLEQVFKNHSIESVIHFAGLKSVGESVSKPIEYYHNNLTGSLVLFDLMQKYKVKNLVFSSSATVYGNPEKCPITEEMPLSTTNPYGTTKLMIEQILQDICIANPDWKVAILRYFNPVGAHKSGLIGEMPNNIPNNLMPYISKVASGKLAKLSVFGNDYHTKDGTGVRDYIHVVDLSIAHLKALDKIRKEQGGSYVYNIGTGVGYSVLELVKAFENANDVTVAYEITKRRPGDIATCYADPSKAEKELGFKTVASLEDMCKDSWGFEKGLKE